MTDCISSLQTLLNTSKDDIRVWCLYSYSVHVVHYPEWGTNHRYRRYARQLVIQHFGYSLMA